MGLNTLVAVLIVFLIFAIIYYFIDRMGIPLQFLWIVRIIVGILAIVALLQFVPGLGGLIH